MSRSASVAAGSAANAASVGAKTVKGPGPLSVAIRSAAVSAFARVVKPPAATACKDGEGGMRRRGEHARFWGTGDAVLDAARMRVRLRRGRNARDLEATSG